MENIRKRKVKDKQKPKTTFQLSFANSQSVPESKQAPTRASKGDHNVKNKKFVSIIQTAI